MQLNGRQQRIVEIVKECGPITGERVASKLHLTRASLRPDLAFLTQNRSVGSQTEGGLLL